jgi:hypothetical protein
VRGDARFPAVVARAEEGRRRAAAIYREHGGESLLGVAAAEGAPAVR